jgi:hypothetical protein
MLPTPCSAARVAIACPRSRVTETSEGLSLPAPCRFTRDAAAHGAYLLIPAVSFGALLGVQVGRNLGTGWLAIVSGGTGVAIAMYWPSPARRRANMRRFIDRMVPSERPRWEQLLLRQSRGRLAAALAPPVVGLLALLAYAALSLPWPDPPPGDMLAVLVLAVAGFGTLSLGVQWLVVGWLAWRHDRG